MINDRFTHGKQMGNVLDGLKNEGEELETTEDKSSESNKEEETGADQNKNTAEENLPFHEHPRFKELVSEKNKFKEEAESLKARMEEIESRLESNDEEDGSIEIPATPYWFTGSEEDWKNYYLSEEKRMSQIEERAVEKAIARIEEKQANQSKEAQTYEKWVEDGLETLKESGAKFDQNKLLKIMVDYKPSDEEGSLDFNKGYEIYQLLESKDNKGSQERKIIADTKGSSRTVSGEGYEGKIRIIN